MSVDLATVKRVARLARLAVSEEEAQKMVGELNGILGFVEQLSEVNVKDVEPMTSVTPMVMRKRVDVINDGDKAAEKNDAVDDVGRRHELTGHGVTRLCCCRRR